ncbi:MAG: M56 family metallopeptidase [Rikenellaceae bacterium]|jgi:TonB family protein|nr:M56 family metallopeptidase [Rikenellaceae bacterium]
MKEILMYVLGVVVCSGVFTAFYRAVMYQRTSFRTARVFLIASMVVATIIPAFDIPVWQSEPIELPAFEFTGTPAASPVAEAQVDIWPVALLCLWGMGVAMLACLMIVQAVKIHRTKRHSEVYASGGCEVAVSAEIESPFSFLQTIYVTSGTPPSEMQQIVLHEASHIRHRHSVEKIFAETLKTLLWFNPFAWITARLLNEVQEFEADRDVLLGGCTVEEYLPVIFRQVFGYAPEISTALGNSLTKKRFEMMTKKFKHNRHSWLRTVGAVPLVAAMMMLFGFTHRAPEVIIEEPETTAVTVVGYGMERKPNTTEITTVTVGSDGVKGLTIRSRNGESDKEVRDFSKLIIWLENENREITFEEMNALAPSTIESINVFKESAAMKPYLDKTGKESADGVIVVTLGSDNSKSSLSAATANKLRGAAGPDKMTQVSVLNIQKTGTAGVEEVLSMDKSNVFIWLLNESKEISKAEMNAIDPNSIEAISVLKGEDNYTAEIHNAMGDRKFDSAVLIGLKAPEVSAASQAVEEEPVFIVEEMPTFQGGDLVAFRNWVHSNMTYPKAAVDKKIQGKVTLQFVIEKDGALSGIKVLSSPDQLLSDAAIEALKKSPKWNPGKQRGKLVRVTFVLPIDFSLTK